MGYIYYVVSSLIRTSGDEMAKNCRDSYIAYYFLGMAATENDKVFYWSQWEPCFHILDEILAPFSKKSWMRCSASFEITLKPYKNDPPGTRNITKKAVPMGKMRWCYEDNKKWSEALKPSEPGPHPIIFEDTVVHSSKFKDNHGNPRKNYPEILVSVFNHPAWVINPKHNQALSICFEEAYYVTKPAEYWDRFISTLDPIMHTVRMARTRRPYYMERPYSAPWAKDGMMECHTIDCDFCTRFDILDLESTWQSWEILK